MKAEREEAGSGEPLLLVDSLRIGFGAGDGHLQVVHGISFSVRANETVALVGESGCGKSVTALSLARLLPGEPACRVRGSIRLAGEEVLLLPPSRLRYMRHQKIAYVFQDPAASLNPVLRVGFQICEVLEGGRRARREEALSFLSLAGLPEPERCFAAYPHELSGGMQQRVVIAMALARRPAMLVADEPTTALDVTIQAQILSVLAEAQRQLGMALLLITHNLGLVAGSADRVLVMYAGHLVESGPVESVLQAPAHPYTSGLLRVVPRLEMTATRLEGIPGSVPPPGTLLRGCPFAPRCTRATNLCSEQVPVMVDAAARPAPYRVACFHPLGEGERT